MTTWKRLTIYCVSFIGVFFIGITFDLACGPEPDPYDYYITFFHNNLQQSQGYRPFYFSGYTFLNGYTDDVEDDNKAAEADINVKEWRNYLGPGVTYKDVSRILYETSRTTDSLYFWNYPNNTFPFSLKHNSFIKKLRDNKKALAYLLLAKKIEPFVKPSDDDEWKIRESEKAREHAFALKYIQMGIGLRDKFLKLRCFYQAQRLLHYGGNTAEAAAFYDLRIKNIISGSHVIGWALNLRAGEDDLLGHKEEAAYLYSKAFALCPERRVRTYCDFLRSKVPVAKVIKLAKNNHEKAFIYAIKGFHNPAIGLSTLKNVYRTDPGSAVLTVLLAREINKIEEHYLTPWLNGGNYYDSIGFWDHDKYDSVKSYYITYIPKLKAFCNQLATEHKCPDPALGYLGSAYLSWIIGDTKAGLDTLSRVNDNRISTKLYDEKQLIKLLLLSQSIKKMDKVSEDELVPSLTWLEKKVIQERSLQITGSRYWSDYAMKYYSASSRDFYAKVLAPKYLKQKDTARAALCILKSEKTIRPVNKYYSGDHELGFNMPAFWQTSIRAHDIKKILKWHYSPAKTPFLRLLMKMRDKNMVTNIYDLLGTACLREHRYPEAVKAFRQVGSAKLNHAVAIAFDNPSRYANPFIDQLNDYPAGYQGSVDNKLTFAIAMAELQRQIKINPKNAAAPYFKMALGLYNTSYFGNAWYYSAYSWAGNDYLNGIIYDYSNDYLREKTAERYFLKARGLGSSNEFKARCTFMAAKCRQKQIAIPADYEQYLAGRKFDLDESTPNTKKYNDAVRNNLYFKTLQIQYSKTTFYQTAVHECSYFRDFLKGENK